MKLRTGSLALSLFISSQFKMLASHNSQHSLKSAVRLNAFKPQYNLGVALVFFWKTGLACPP